MYKIRLVPLETKFDDIESSRHLPYGYFFGGLLSKCYFDSLLLLQHLDYKYQWNSRCCLYPLLYNIPP